MAKSTCKDCNRMVVLAQVGGERLAFDPEIVTVLPGTLHRGGEGVSLRHAAETVPARRLHAERCDTYREADRKARISAEMRDFNKKQRSGARRNQGL
jgi:hypothetical protein